MSLRVLVTGGCGGVGKALCHRLIRFGARVTVLDDMSMGSPVGLPDAVSLQVGDVADPHVAARAVSDSDVIVHLAAVASVSACTEDPVRGSNANYMSTVSLLQVSGTRPVIFTSSAAVYGEGDDDGRPNSEGRSTEPISSYAIDKLASEQLLRLTCRARTTTGMILRPFNIYGAGQPADTAYSGVITRFLSRAKNGQSLEIYGDGRQSRDFIHIDDITRAIVTAVEKTSDQPAGHCATFNLSSGQRTTIRDLATKVNWVTGNTAPTVFLSAKSQDIRHSVGDPRHAAEVLGFRARVSLAQGIAGLLDADGSACVADATQERVCMG